MRVTLVFSLLVGAGCGFLPVPPAFSTGGANTPAEAGKTYHFRFDETPTGNLPGDFIHVLGDWNVAEDGTAPSPSRVLRQSGIHASPDFPRVIVKDLSFTNLTVKVQCRAESGVVDQACGLMFRLQDSENYFITRANVLEGNVRLYRVIRSVREEIASADLTVTANEWNTLEASADGANLTVSWNGTQVLSKTDNSFPTGKIGLWTKADSVVSFDNLEATAN